MHTPQVFLFSSTSRSCVQGPDFDHRAMQQNLLLSYKGKAFWKISAKKKQNHKIVQRTGQCFRDTRFTVIVCTYVVLKIYVLIFFHLNLSPKLGKFEHCLFYWWLKTSFWLVFIQFFSVFIITFGSCQDFSKKTCEKKFSFDRTFETFSKMHFLCV